jgi:DNA-binding NarL/FixJ family response regulator
MDHEWIQHSRIPMHAQEALSLGARCYVVKVKDASELLTAVESVLLGKTFVTSIIGSG